MRAVSNRVRIALFDPNAEMVSLLAINAEWVAFSSKTAQMVGLTAATDNNEIRARRVSASPELTVSTYNTPHPMHYRTSLLLLAPVDRRSIKPTLYAVSPYNCSLACDRLTHHDWRTRFAAKASRAAGAGRGGVA